MIHDFQCIADIASINLSQKVSEALSRKDNRHICFQISS